MSSARLLVVVLLLSLAALGQNRLMSSAAGRGSLSSQPDILQGTSVPRGAELSLLEPKTTVPALEQLPNDSQAFPPTAEATKRMEQTVPYLASHGFNPNNQQLTIGISPQEQVTAERAEVCYTMRSYLMARDSKDSDSTHLVGVSTCQPARQYGLKTTDLPSDAVER